MFKKLFRKTSDYPQHEINESKKNEEKENDNTAVNLKENSYILGFVKELEYSLKNNIILQLKPNEYSTEDNYKLKDYSLSLPKRELILYLMPVYFEGEDVVVLDCYQIGVSYRNITSIDHMGHDKYYINTLDENQRVVTQRIFTGVGNEDIKSVKSIEVKTNYYNARYKPVPYIPEYESLKNESPLNYRFQERIDVLGKSEENVHFNQIIQDKNGIEYLLYCTSSENNSMQTVCFNVYIVTTRRENLILQLEYKKEEKILKIVSFHMGNYAGKSLGQQVLRLTEDYVCSNFNVKMILGVLSTVDDPNLDRRNHVYEKLGYKVTQEFISKSVKCN